jgi:hypothetical protein
MQSRARYNRKHTVGNRNFHLHWRKCRVDRRSTSRSRGVRNSQRDTRCRMWSQCGWRWNRVDIVCSWKRRWSWRMIRSDMKRSRLSLRFYGNILEKVGGVIIGNGLRGKKKLCLFFWVTRYGKWRLTSCRCLVGSPSRWIDLVGKCRFPRDIFYIQVTLGRPHNNQ